MRLHCCGRFSTEQVDGASGLNLLRDDTASSRLKERELGPLLKLGGAVLRVFRVADTVSVSVRRG